MSAVLQKIAERTRESLERRKLALPETELRKHCQEARVPHDFRGAFDGTEIRAIAEIKFASPSEGQIVSMRDPVTVARGYLEGGATALSVLTEESYFHGSLSFLAQVRTRFPSAFLLMKDFVIDPYQILEGLHHGADAVLLIVSLLGKERTQEYLSVAAELGLSALVEVHDERELEVARDAGALLVGINNRNLNTLDVSLETSFRLIKYAETIFTRRPAFISESGIKSPAEVKQLGNAGFSGILVGTSLMKTADPGLALTRLLGRPLGKNHAGAN